MKINFSSPLLWLTAALLSGFCYYFSYQFFPKTFPIIHLDISMDRSTALEKAASIANSNHFGPQEYQQAAMFNTDSTTKTFVELEAGGKDAFVAMMDNNVYMPYTWNIRHFKESEKNEVTIRLTPNGTPYGFIETISEELPGATLTESEANSIAQKEATTNWAINFDPYKQIEASQKTQPSGRIDHTFIWERIHERIGEGFYRLKLTVSGDKVTELTHFVKVPETFIRRYAQMRSANTMIAWIAQIIIILLYVIGGCIIGLYFIVRQRWHLWKHALYWAIIIAALVTLTTINQLPFFWMYYPTFSSAHAFLMQILLSSVNIFALQTCALTLIIVTAESLTRKAFGNHPQLWSLWLSENRASYSVLGRTLGAYLLIGVNLAFVIGFYWISTNYLGWWNPSEMLFDPNILATYVPSLAPLALSLQAGFMEECLFRAIPLAGAALIGQRLGKKNLWIGAAFIIQALVFGAAHANYPTQPAYARLIELIIPSFMWGGIYLRFGLLTTIITHVVYDVVWFSLPIFISSAPSALFHKIIILLCSFIPVLIVLYGRIKQGAWNIFHSHNRNASWQPHTITKQQEIAEQPIELKGISAHNKTIVLLCGIISLGAWVYFTPFTHDGVRITTTQQEAIAQAQTILTNKNIDLGSSWHTLPGFFTHYEQVPTLQMQHLFIWKEGNKDLYRTLLNNYLEPAHWTIRYAQFEGDLIARAEEHGIYLYDIMRYKHTLPESSAGNGVTLTKEETRNIVHKALLDMYGLDPKTLTEISAQETQHPNRKDWLFIFSDPNIYPLEQGQARISFAITGNTILDTARTIHVPESWQRAYQNDVQKRGIVHLIIIMIFIAMLLIALFFARKHHVSIQYSKRSTTVLFTTLIIIAFVQLLNTWPAIMILCNTMEPLSNQLIQKIGFMFIWMLIKVAGITLIVSAIIEIQKKQKSVFSYSTYLMGIAIGLCIAAGYSVIDYINPIMEPLWPDVTPLKTSFPLIDATTRCFFKYLRITLCASLLTIIINNGSHYYHRNKLFFNLFFIICGLLFTQLSSLSMMTQWLSSGIIIGTILLLLYRKFIRYDSALIPCATGTAIITHIIQQGMFNAYPCASLIAVSNIGIVIMVTVLWTRSIMQNAE